MQRTLTFDVSEDSRHVQLTVVSSHPITIPSYLELVEEWLTEQKAFFADAIKHQADLIRKGRLVLLKKGRT